MEQAWLDQQIADAERAADAAVRLKALKVDALLMSISEARRAVDDATRETAYSNLLNEMAPVLQQLDPITLHDLQGSG